MHFSQKRELFLFPITTLLPSLIVRFYVAVVPPLEEASESWVCVRGRFSSSFLYLPVRLAPSFVRSLFVLCSFFVRSLFVLCSSFVYLPVVLRLPVRLTLSTCRATTSHCFTFYIISIVISNSLLPLNL